MDAEKREALEEAGFRVGDAEDFLGLTKEEALIVEMRVAVGRMIRAGSSIRESNRDSRR